MEWNTWWEPWTGTGLEHLRLVQSDEGNVVDSVVLGISEGLPFRVWYTIRANQDWQVRECTLRLLGGESPLIRLQTDGAGHWCDGADVSLSELDGCVDVDISVTPFTNTLPIRRLSLDPGQSADLLVVYIAVPEMEVGPASQRYTCLERDADGGLYRYESLSSGFTRDLRVDANGLVIDYPGIWKRRE